VVRAYYPETRAAIKAALADGTMQPTLDALNALQSTAWTINKRVLGVIQACIERGIAVPGLPGVDLPLPDKPGKWEDLDDAAKRLWKHRVSQVKQKNRSNTSSHTLLIQDLKTANMLAEHERFWTPMNLDWRGRVYACTHFNFQRDDRVRALFLFADGEPISEEGLYWLKVHVANCADSEKLWDSKGISKRPFDERAKWVNDNLPGIEAIAELPTKELMWTRADKPFLFLAACIELTSALANGPTFVTRLPVSFDGSCSGLQHLSAMTRDEKTAALVNLLPGPQPNDVYQAVADVVKGRLEAIASRPRLDDTAGSGVVGDEGSPQALARRALEFGVDRSSRFIRSPPRATTASTRKASASTWATGLRRPSSSRRQPTKPSRSLWTSRQR
jgi:DNA-directed RNA polymerase